jgi:hypothetical protein
VVVIDKAIIPYENSYRDCIKIHAEKERLGNVGGFTYCRHPGLRDSRLLTKDNGNGTWPTLFSLNSTVGPFDP